jgi:hypothetical protein
MNTIRLGMVGMTKDNGHPYSWSAIFNGYDPAAMAQCPFPVIPSYLGKEPKETLQIPDARVTHIWTDDPADALRVARASRIPNTVAHPEDVIGEVDAIILPVDHGDEHVARCRPFVEAGLPVFVDKTLAESEEDLRTFEEWVSDGSLILASSCMRYCKEFMPFRASTRDLGELRFVSITTSNSWERYGIHALEGIYPILGPGFVSVRNTGTSERNIVHLKHHTGVDVTVVAASDMHGAFGVLQLCGTQGHAHAAFSDRFHAFKEQLLAFVSFLRTGVRPFPFAETVELSRIVIAGIQSRQEGGREVTLEELAAHAST